MKLAELKSLLLSHPDKQFQLRLPNANPVPESFHITEVGMVTKKFIDCGGKIHQTETCQIQAWIGPDIDHRLETGKMASILAISHSVVSDDSLSVEVEYEDTVISQYPVQSAVVTENAVILVLALKHTDCLAKELCVPQLAVEGGCCGGGDCC